MVVALNTTDVPGLSKGPSTPPKLLQIRVVRAFVLEGARQEVDTVLTVPRSFGVDLIAAGKASAEPQPATAAAKALPAAAKAGGKTAAAAAAAP